MLANFEKILLQNYFYLSSLNAFDGGFLS